jgi:WbqC-like protein family
MQPYFFPYLGYWQLISAVDKFILFDDVNFIKQGFINRNTILVQGKPQNINLQIQDISSNKLILEHEINNNINWKKKLLKSIHQNYLKAKYFNKVFPLIEKIIRFDENNVSNYLVNQIIEISKYLGIETEIIKSSVFYPNNRLKGQERIIDICNQESALTYINAIGGLKLYSKEKFKNYNIELKFIKMDDIEYSQFSNVFITKLSIIDVMMFNSVDEIVKLLNKYTLV